MINNSSPRHVPHQRIILLSVAVSGFVCIALGAFGAHALQARLDEQALAVWQTAVQYQMFQTLALFGVVVFGQSSRFGLLTMTAYLFIVGIVLFCGSLYLLALTGMSWMGAITPLGGVCFLLGWGLLLVCFFRAQLERD